MKSKHLAGYLFSALMLTGFQQATAQTTYNGSVAKGKGQMRAEPHMGMAPRCDNQGSWDLWADFLWWTTNFNLGTGLATEVTAMTPGFISTDSSVRVKIKRPSNNWDPGVRIGFGWNTHYDNWDIQGYWTYFYNSTRKKHEPLDVDIVGSPGVGIEKGSQKLRLRYNAADAELGKAYYVSSHFFIRPFTGVHAIWLSQDNNESFNASGDFLTVFTGTKTYSFDTDLDCWGVGPRIGFNTNWGCYRGFSLLGNISGSLLYGEALYKSSLITTSTGSTIRVKLRDEDHWQAIPTMQIQMGLSYACCFGHGRNAFRVSAAWESNFLWETSNFLQNDRPISMQGLTVDVRFDF